DEAIDSHIEAMAELFGRDSTGDMIIDSGLARELHNFLQMYTQTGGLIDTRIAGIDRQITETEDEITDLKRQLEDKEVDLKRQYGRMESALGQLEETSRSIENFNTQNSD
ncbi:MAG: flagellar filament capping protein FliD, partial [Sediminispirochaetaceae bacterium]